MGVFEGLGTVLSFGFWILGGFSGRQDRMEWYRMGWTLQFFFCGFDRKWGHLVVIISTTVQNFAVLLF